MMHAPIDVDATRWIRVPIDFAEERWEDGSAWADWVARSAAPEDEDRRRSIHRIASALVALPSENAVARYWHFPEDGDPGASLDVTLALGAGEPLLPEAPPTVVEPLERAVDAPGFDRAARRRGLVPVGLEPGGTPGAAAGTAPVLALVEWAAAVDGIVVGMTAADTDPARLSRLVVDGDALLAGLDGRALARLVTR